MVGDQKCELASDLRFDSNAIIRACPGQKMAQPPHFATTKRYIDAMNRCHLPFLLICLCLQYGCTREPPPRSVSELMDDRLLLEAALVRCTKDRAATRYEVECVNAREAVKQIEAKEEANRRSELEAQSQRKRDALRRTQQAAAAARRRVAEAEKQRQEAEYLAQFGVPPDGTDGEAEPGANIPMAVIPEAADETVAEDTYFETPYEETTIAEPPATDGDKATATETSDENDTDLGSIRDELRRRNDESEN